MIAWVHDSAGREAFGPVPPSVTVADLPEDPASDPRRHEVEFIVPRWLDGIVLDALPALRVIQLCSAGVDWIVDAVPEGVTLCDAAGARDGAMAEWVIGALLADAKNARACAEQQSRQVWEAVGITDLAGARVLVLGYGSIGRAVAQRLAPFGVELVAVARTARDGVHGIDELDDLLPGADAVVDLLPLTPATRGLVDARVLARMSPGSLLINAGRGATVDTAALVEALRARHVRAVLDVVDPEPLPPGHPLWTAPGVLISPHSAGDTRGADRAAWALAGDQLRRYAAGEPLRNVVRDGY
ncbi:MAG: D-isomer specific 2-hydroxyacid dehydrogenase NAD-binding protein [Solirubrobacterales bacterium]|nr:D-isomer specific 2-hydroxyacid dehydrogenase NAD-binding protein [Solirubrobacterales bacterium]